MARVSFEDNKKLTVVNLFSGPGTGKSVTAARLFAHMKVQQHKVELLHEIPKDYVWERWNDIFGEQDYIFAHQHRLIRRLVSHDVKYAVVDSSMLLSLFYLPDDFPQSFRQFVVDAFNTYDNFNVILTRNPSFAYQQWGRNETLEQAQVIDAQIQDFFQKNNMHYITVQSGDGAELVIYDELMRRW